MQAYTTLHNNIQNTVKQLNNLRLKHAKEWLLITITISNTEHIVLKSYNVWIQRIEYRDNGIISRIDGSPMDNSVKSYKAFLFNYLQFLK
jgi:hypothetical protein